MIKSILCVDDIENNLFVLSTILGKEKDYTIYTASSGQSAFEILLKEKIDLILLDIMMPEMDGFEVATMVKNSPITKTIPIIFVTAKTDEESIKEAYQNGGVDYIVKPYRAYELLERVKLQLQLKEAEAKLNAKQKILESILDQQDNMIITTNGIEVFRANKAFLKFFHLVDMQELKEITNITNYFQSCIYYDIDEFKNRKDWLDYLYNHNSDRDFIVSMTGALDTQKYAFMLNVTKMDNKEEYVVTFTDVTNLIIETKDLADKACHDQLTGLYNRAKLNEFVNYEIEIAQRYKNSLSMILFDIDDFKKVNDTYGHLQGDEVLKKISYNTQQKIRKTDFFARWGGEEFIIIAPLTAINSIINLAQNIRITIERINFGEMGTITSSFGVTSYQKGDSMESMIERVDEAMYKAKREGKNRVEVG
ncbi:MAG: diguanylate cyclase [Sulfurovum sp.]